MRDVGQLVISLAFCPKHWLLVRLKLTRIPRGRIVTGTGGLSKVCPLPIYSKPVLHLTVSCLWYLRGQVVHTFIEEEFLRSCAITLASLPKESHREGWGAPGMSSSSTIVFLLLTAHEGTKYEDVCFRSAIFDTVSTIG